MKTGFYSIGEESFLCAPAFDGQVLCHGSGKNADIFTLPLNSFLNVATPI